MVALTSLVVVWAPSEPVQVHPVVDDHLELTSGTCTIVRHLEQPYTVRRPTLTSRGRGEFVADESPTTFFGLQTGSCVTVSDLQAKIKIKELDLHRWLHVVEDSPSLLSLGRQCNELSHSLSWPSELPDDPNG